MTVKTLKVSEAKSKFSEVLADVVNGETIYISKGQQPEPIAKIVAVKPEKKKKIIFGELEKYGQLKIADSWEMTAEELLDL